MFVHALPSGVFFSQELSRYSLLLTIICQTLVQLQQAIKGLVASSAETDSLFEAISRNQVRKTYSSDLMKDSP